MDQANLSIFKLCRDQGTIFVWSSDIDYQPGKRVLYFEDPLEVIPYRKFSDLTPEQWVYFIGRLMHIESEYAPKDYEDPDTLKKLKELFSDDAGKLLIIEWVVNNNNWEDRFNRKPITKWIDYWVKEVDPDCPIVVNEDKSVMRIGGVGFYRIGD